MAREEARFPPVSAQGTNFYDADLNLQFEVRHRVEAHERLRTELWAREVGRIAGGILDRLAAKANANPPQFEPYDMAGNRIDLVDYHPSYRAMESIAFERLALAALSHQAGLLGWPVPVPHTVKYILSYIFAQAEFGLLCPVSMTDAAARVLRKFGSPELKEKFLPRLTSPRMRDLWQGAMFITEKQAGSDVGAIETVARRDGEHWRLYGQKWFCSNVNADVILTLARPEGGRTETAGLGMFLIPRVLPDGTRNALRINRLKNKLGSRSMATGEVDLQGALAYQVGELENGFRQMAEMINVSRLSNAIRSAGLMRRGLHEAIWYARHRRAFGQRLVNLPLMRVNLTDLLIEVEAATAFVMAAAQYFDRADEGDRRCAMLLRILTPLGKYAICRRARRVTADAMDVRGGNGYIEDSVNPRLVRDAHLGSIWEGTSNIVALDVIRAFRREKAGDVLLEEVSAIVNGCKQPSLRVTARTLLSIHQRLRARLKSVAASDRLHRESLARSLSESLYALTAAALLLQEAQWQLDENGSARKLFVSRLFIRRNLKTTDPLALDEPILSEEQFEALVDWTPLDPKRAALP